MTLQTPHPETPSRAGNSLRIALLSYRSAPFSGGQGIYVRHLSAALLGLGHQVDVLSGPPYPHLVDGVGLIKIPGLDLYANGLGSLRATHLRSATNIAEWLGKLSGGFTEPYAFGQRAFRFLQDRLEHYDILHDNQCLSPGLLRLQRDGAALVTTIHHPVVRDFRLALDSAPNWRARALVRRWYFFLSMQRRVAQQLEHVITVSEASRRDISVDFELPAERVRVVPNGVDTALFAPREGVARDPEQIIATASADHPLKGIRYLLEAVAMLRRERPGIRLLLIGQLRPDSPAGALLQRLGIADAVRVVGGIDAERIAGHYAGSAVAVVPSLYEGFGLPAVEAMACALPVVSTDAGALPEVVGEVGVMVPPADPARLAGAIGALLDDPARRAALGRAGRERALSHFSWRSAATATVHCYRRALAERAGALASDEPNAIYADG